MKKLLSIILAMFMLLSVLVSSVLAEDNVEILPPVEENPVYVDADFTTDGGASKDFYLGNYKSDGENLVGYKDALAFQSVGAWSSYDATYDVTFCEDDTITEEVVRSFSFAYINPNMKHNGVANDNYTIGVYYDITNGAISIVGDSFWPNGSNNIVDPVPFQFKDNVRYALGVSITEGRIRVFVDGELIIDYVDVEDKYYIGYSYEEVEPSIILWWNSNNCLIYHDVLITAPAYQYRFIPYGDADGDGDIKLGDCSVMLKHIAGWEGVEIDVEAADVDCDGTVKLSDVSTMLKYIAGWDHIVLGPHEKCSFTEWMPTKYATYTEAGEEKRYCIECGETEYREIPMLSVATVFSELHPAIAGLGYFEFVEDIDGYTLFEWTNGFVDAIESNPDYDNMKFAHTYSVAELNEFSEMILGVTVDYSALVGSYMDGLAEIAYDAEADTVTVTYNGAFGDGGETFEYNGYEKIDDTTYVGSYAHDDGDVCKITVKFSGDSFVIVSHVKVTEAAQPEE